MSGIWLNKFHIFIGIIGGSQWSRGLIFENREWGENARKTSNGSNCCWPMEVWNKPRGKGESQLPRGNSPIELKRLKGEEKPRGQSEQMGCQMIDLNRQGRKTACEAPLRTSWVGETVERKTLLWPRCWWIKAIPLFEGARKSPGPIN